MVKSACVWLLHAFVKSSHIILSIKEFINQFNDTFLRKFSLSTPIDTLWEEFKLMCLNCLTHVPTKLSTKQPWITSHNYNTIVMQKTMSL